MPTVKVTEKNKYSRPAHPSRAADYMKRYYAASFRFRLNAPSASFDGTSSLFARQQTIRHGKCGKKKKIKRYYMKCVLAAPQFYYDGVFHNIIMRISLIYRQNYSVYIIRETHV